MPVDVSLIAERLREQLIGIGLDAERVDVAVIDGSSQTFSVKITSGDFEGQTYLDREMRVRPAVARAFSAAGNARASFVIDVETPDEASTALRHAEEVVSEVSAVEAGAEERSNRRVWREQQVAVRRALEASGFQLAELEQDLWVAARTQLSEEKLLVAFARSPGAKTVDLDLRKAINLARSSQRFAATHYISPDPLASPYANQPLAPWMQLHTTASFLHALAGSHGIATTLRLQVSPEDQAELKLRGVVIEPDVKTADNAVLEDRFFSFIEEWSKRPQPSLLVLLAPAGHGKTTLTLELTRRLAERFLDRPQEAAVPLLSPFESVRRTVDFEALVHKRVAELKGASYGAFVELLRLNKALLLVDGFDELADDAGLTAAEHQVRSMRPLLAGSAKILLAGRALFAQQFAGTSSVQDRVRSLIGDVDVEVLELVPFRREQIDAFISSREGLTVAQRLEVKRFADSTPDHEDLCSNPLFLRILCSLAAGGALPKNTDVAVGVDALIERICEREERRQHLGIGAKGQLEFLGWLATDIFRSGGVSMRGDDVGVIAAAVAEQLGNRDTELVGRLRGHALLASTPDDKIAFIHPFFRDTILGNALVRQIEDEKRIPLSSALGDRDLPLAAVQKLASHANVVAGALRDGWLADATGMSSKTRRNLFRVLVEASHRSQSGNPRQWMRAGWAAGGVVRSLDLSGLVIESASFDGVELVGVDVSYSLIDDCDFRGTRIRNCKIVSCTFSDCRFSRDVTVTASEVTDVAIQVGRKSVEVQRDTALAAAFVESCPDMFEPREKLSDEVAAAARGLIAAVLAQFVQREPAHFHYLNVKTFRVVGRNDSEQAALDRVVIPQVLNTFCDVEFAERGIRQAGIAKRWRPSVLEFVRDGRMTASFEEACGKIVAKAARYLA